MPEIGRPSLWSSETQHLAYSLELVPSDYCVILNHKKHLKGRQLSSIEEAILAADGQFVAQSK
jgi:hypothetical protein